MILWMKDVSSEALSALLLFPHLKYIVLPRVKYSLLNVTTSSRLFQWKSQFLADYVNKKI